MTAGELKADIDWLISNIRKGPGCYPFGAGEPVTNSCEIVLSGKKGSNGQELNVRCKCMSQVRSRRPFFNYDTIGTAVSLPGALDIWRRHKLLLMETSR